MKTRLYSFIVMSAVLLSACSSDDPSVTEVVENPSGTPENVDPLPEIKNLELTATEKVTIDELTALAFDFNHRVRTTPGVTANTHGNYCLSPASLVICLNLMVNSIDAPYDTRIADFFGFSNVDALSSLGLKLQAYLPASGSGVAMKLANSVWYSSRFSVSDDYRQRMLSTFHVPATALKFSDTDEALRIINSWCRENTDGMIENPVKNIDPNTVVSFANALYFEGAWWTPFDKELSTQAVFHGTAGDASVNMMNQIANLLYAGDGDFEYVSLPFSGANFSLELLMSATGKEISVDAYNALRNRTELYEVNLSLPSFSINWDASLEDVYDDLGSLTKNATLTAMGLPDYVRIEKQAMLQATAFEINEEGARAAAVTVSDEFWAAHPSEDYNVTLTFDRPFTYIVRDSRSGAIVFIGAVNNL